MTPGRFAVVYLVALGVFLALDAVWLGLVARTFYRREVGPLLASPPNWGAAAIFYLVYVTGIVIFAIRPGLDANSIATAATMGALFGFYTYATYDFTNLATLKGWTWRVVAVDVAWGTALGCAVATVTTAILRNPSTSG